MTAALARDAQTAYPRKAQVPCNAAAIADSAVRCLLKELETWPKPGLVSHIDRGSHRDMDAGTFRSSAAAIGPYLRLLAEAAAEGCGMGRLRIIGIEAERAMLAATSGATRIGAPSSGSACCRGCRRQSRRAGRSDAAARSRRLARLGQQHTGRTRVVAQPWQRGSPPFRRRRRSPGGGKRISSVYQIGLPALRRGSLAAPGDAEAARVEACFSLIASVEDTNLLHRGGLDGLSFARRATRRFLDEGGVCKPDWRTRAQSVHRDFIARRLSPGGSADLLAMTLFVEAHDGGRP